MSAQTDYLNEVAMPLLGIVESRPGGYLPVCLRCRTSLRMLLERRSFALVALDIHGTDCPGRAS